MRVQSCQLSTGRLHLSTKSANVTPADIEWAAGIIDGDGHFRMDREKYPVCIVSTHEDEVETLYRLQDMFGGTVGRISDNKKTGLRVRACHWRLSKREKVKAVILALNGHIRTPIRYGQLCKACAIFGIAPQQALPMSKESAWTAGFFEADGIVQIRREGLFADVSITQKDATVLVPVEMAHGGKTVYVDKENPVWMWILYEPEIRDFTRYLLLHVRATAKRKQLLVLEELLRLRAATPRDNTAILELKEKYWAKRDADKLAPDKTEEELEALKRKKK